MSKRHVRRFEQAIARRDRATARRLRCLRSRDFRRAMRRFTRQCRRLQVTFECRIGPSVRRATQSFERFRRAFVPIGSPAFSDLQRGAREMADMQAMQDRTAKILSGPSKVYIGPVGEGVGDPQWTDLGYTHDGIEVEAAQ